MGRNIFRDSGFKDWDMSIFKNFTFKERYGIQVRWEVFNVLNHPIAANPSGASSFVNTGNSPGPGAAFGASVLDAGLRGRQPAHRLGKPAGHAGRIETHLLVGSAGPALPDRPLTWKNQRSSPVSFGDDG